MARKAFRKVEAEPLINGNGLVGEVVIAPLDSVKPNDYNPNRLTEFQKRSLRHGLKTKGWFVSQSLLIWRTDEKGTKQNVIIDGEHRWVEARAIGLSHGPMVFLDGLTKQQVMKLTVELDNKRGELDQASLAQLLGQLGDPLDSLGLELGFDDQDIARLLAFGQPIGSEVDEPVLPVRQPVTKLGDLYVLGKHRLLCGDSTNPAAVAQLFDGATPNLMVTDPPYGVEYDANWRQEAAAKGLIQHAERRVGIVQNDDRADWSEAYRHFKGNVCYVWHAGVKSPEVAASITRHGFELRALIVWAKARFAISRGHYHHRHEPCWYGVRGQADWIGDRKQTTLWDIQLDKNVEGGHSTQKPVECMARPMRNHQGDVYDPFVGSGTTIIAAELLGRRCYAMEIDPGYCDAVVKRWEQHTGKKAQKP